METTSECSDCGGEELLEPSLLLLVPVLLSVVWAVVQLLYGPWLMALLLTKVVNVFLKDSGISIGMCDDELDQTWCRCLFVLV